MTYIDGKEHKAFSQDLFKMKMRDRFSKLSILVQLREPMFRIFLKNFVRSGSVLGLISLETFLCSGIKSISQRTLP